MVGNMIVIALSGGPCGGKTTLSKEISPYLEGFGYNVFKIPESATTMISSGIKPKEWTHQAIVDFQRSIIKLQLHMENSIFQIASNNSPAVVICDRGALDGKAYSSQEQWQEVLWSIGYSEDQLRDRYHAVVHLSSAVMGVPHRYTFGHSSDSNVARYENHEEAILSEQRTLDAWKDHPNRILIPNENDDFAFKLSSAKRIILNLLKERA